MRVCLWLVASVVLTWSVSVSAADCAYPQAPGSVPDGKTASEAEMIAADSRDQAAKAWGKWLADNKDKIDLTDANDRVRIALCGVNGLRP